MSEATKRLRRKDLRAPDEFVTTTNQIVEWARQNTQIVAIAAGALLAAVLIVVGVRWFIHGREERATRDFYAADELFKRQQWDEAGKSFAELAENLGGTSYGKLARLYVGRSALRAGKNAEAVTAIQEFLQDPIGGPSIEQLARLNLGSALAGTGDAAAARDQWAKALELDGPAKGEALINLAQGEDKAGNKDKALELYQRYLQDEPEGTGRDLARTRIVALGGTPPAAPSGLPGLPPGINIGPAQ
jgi:hypothetical protein